MKISMKMALFSLSLVALLVVFMHAGIVSAFDDEVFSTPIANHSNTVQVVAELGDLYRFTSVGKINNLVFGSMNSEGVGITIQPGAIQKFLRSGDYTPIDLNKDGKDDIKIKVVSSTAGKATLWFNDGTDDAPIIEAKPATNTSQVNSSTPVEQNTTKESTNISDDSVLSGAVVEGSSSSSYSVLYYIFGAIIIAAIAYYFLVVRNAHSFPKPSRHY